MLSFVCGLTNKLNKREDRIKKIRGTSRLGLDTRWNGRVARWTRSPRNKVHEHSPSFSATL